MNWYMRHRRTARTADPSPDASGFYPDMPQRPGIPAVPLPRKRRRPRPGEAKPVSSVPPAPRSVPATPAAEGKLPGGVATTAPLGATSR